MSRSAAASTEHLSDLEHLAADAEAGQFDREAVIGADDDHRHVTILAREYAETMLAKLRHLKTRRWTYLAVCRGIGAARLSHAEFRLVHYLVERADADLDNSFPSLRTIARALCLRETQVKRMVTRLIGAGWLTRHRFSRPNGQDSSNGYQFRVPPGMLCPNASGWDGPKGFRKRKQVRRGGT